MLLQVLGLKKIWTTSPIIYLSLDEPNPFCPYMFISDQGAPTFCAMEGQSGTSENRPEEEEYVEIEVEESPPEDEGLVVVDVEKEITRPRSTYLPGAPRVGTNYKWPGLLKKAAPGYKSLPGFKDHDVQMARDLKHERESKTAEEDLQMGEVEEDLQMGEASELIPPDKEACSSDSVFGDPQTLEKASPPQSSVLLPSPKVLLPTPKVLLPTPKVLLPTPKPKVPGSAQPKSPIGPPPKKTGV